jgi:predicted RNase H-like HicB family nuclease
MNIGSIIVRNQIEDRLDILEFVRSSGAFRTNRECGTAAVHFWTSLKCSGRFTASGNVVGAVVGGPVCWHLRLAAGSHHCAVTRFVSGHRSDAAEWPGEDGADRRRGQASRYNRAMSFDDYKVVLYRQDDGPWVAEIPALGGCYALMDTREAALAELEQVFALIAQEHRERGIALPKDTTEIVHA